MNENRPQDKIERLERELEKSKAREQKCKSALKDVRKELNKERKKKDVKQIKLSEEQRQLISNLLPDILTLNS